MNPENSVPNPDPDNPGYLRPNQTANRPIRTPSSLPRNDDAQLMGHQPMARNPHDRLPNSRDPRLTRYLQTHHQPPRPPRPARPYSVHQEAYIANQAPTMQGIQSVQEARPISYQPPMNMHQMNMLNTRIPQHIQNERIQIANARHGLSGHEFNQFSTMVSHNHTAGVLHPMEMRQSSVITRNIQSIEETQRFEAAPRGYYFNMYGEVVLIPPIDQFNSGGTNICGTMVPNRPCATSTNGTQILQDYLATNHNRQYNSQPSFQHNSTASIVHPNNNLATMYNRVPSNMVPGSNPASHINPPMLGENSATLNNRPSCIMPSYSPFMTNSATNVVHPSEENHSLTQYNRVPMLQRSDLTSPMIQDNLTTLNNRLPNIMPRPPQITYEIYPNTEPNLVTNHNGQQHIRQTYSPLITNSISTTTNPITERNLMTNQNGQQNTPSYAPNRNNSTPRNVGQNQQNNMATPYSRVPNILRSHRNKKFVQPAQANSADIYNPLPNNSFPYTGPQRNDVASTSEINGAAMYNRQHNMTPYPHSSTPTVFRTDNNLGVLYNQLPNRTTTPPLCIDLTKTTIEDFQELPYPPSENRYIKLENNHTSNQEVPTEPNRRRASSTIAPIAQPPINAYRPNYYIEPDYKYDKKTRTYRAVQPEDRLPTSSNRHSRDRPIASNERKKKTWKAPKRCSSTSTFVPPVVDPNLAFNQFMNNQTGKTTINQPIDPLRTFPEFQSSVQSLQSRASVSSSNRSTPIQNRYQSRYRPNENRFIPDIESDNAVYMNIPKNEPPTPIQDMNLQYKPNGRLNEKTQEGTHSVSTESAEGRLLIDIKDDEDSERNEYNHTNSTRTTSVIQKNEQNPAPKSGQSYVGVKNPRLMYGVKEVHQKTEKRQNITPNHVPTHTQSNQDFVPIQENRRVEEVCQMNSQKENEQINKPNLMKQEKLSNTPKPSHLICDPRVIDIIKRPYTLSAAPPRYPVDHDIPNVQPVPKRQVVEQNNPSRYITLEEMENFFRNYDMQPKLSDPPRYPVDHDIPNVQPVPKRQVVKQNNPSRYVTLEEMENFYRKFNMQPKPSDGYYQERDSFDIEGSKVPPASSKTPPPSSRPPPPSAKATPPMNFYCPRLTQHPRTKHQWPSWPGHNIPSTSRRQTAPKTSAKEIMKLLTQEKPTKAEEDYNAKCKLLSMLKEKINPKPRTRTEKYPQPSTSQGRSMPLLDFEPIQLINPNNQPYMNEPSTSAGASSRPQKLDLPMKDFNFFEWDRSGTPASQDIDNTELETISVYDNNGKKKCKMIVKQISTNSESGVRMRPNSPQPGGSTTPAAPTKQSADRRSANSKPLPNQKYTSSNLFGSSSEEEETDEPQ